MAASEAVSYRWVLLWLRFYERDASRRTLGPRKSESNLLPNTFEVSATKSSVLHYVLTLPRLGKPNSGTLW
jgi:hypothetical protein